MPSDSLQRRLGFWPASAVIIGSIIGAGVFMKPASMAADLGDPVWLSLVWVIAGVFSLLGAFIYAALGAVMPETGGMYVYSRRLFGNLPAFLYGWAAFAVINTASVAAISFVCAQYADHFFHLPRLDEVSEQAVVWQIPFIGRLYPLENLGVKILAVALVILLTILNYRTLKGGSFLQMLSTMLKIGVLAFLVIGIFASGNGSVENFVVAESPRRGWELLNGVVAALTGAFFAYDGWINVNSMAGEIKDPRRNIPRSLIAGVVTCIAVYLFTNLAYLFVMPVEQVASSRLVAADAARQAFGHAAESLVAGMIAVCAFGAINGNLMATCRITYAMGKNRVFFPRVGKENKFGLPGNALLLHAAVICIFILTGSFDMLADMFVFVTWIAYGLGAAAVFVLRKQLMEAGFGKYRYYAIPFMAFVAFYLVMTVYNDIFAFFAGRQAVIHSAFALLIIAAGLPVYYYYKKFNRKSAS